jgi:hypothetical protein
LGGGGLFLRTGCQVAAREGGGWIAKSEECRVKGEQKGKSAERKATVI